MTPDRPTALATRITIATAIGCAFAGALLGFSPPAAAGVVVQQHSFDLFAATAPLLGEGSTAKADNTLLTYQRWNPALGTLTSARWVLSSWLLASGIGHVSSTSTDPNQLVEGEVSLQLLAGATSLVGTGATPASLVLNHGFGFGCTTSLALGTCDIDLNFSEAVNGVLQATELWEFEGLGAFNQVVEASVLLSNVARSAAVDISSSAALHHFGEPGTAWAGRLALVYEYSEPGGSTTVPEPTSVLLAGLGLAVMGGVRRFRPGFAAASAPRRARHG